MAQYIKTEEGYKEIIEIVPDISTKMDKTNPTGTGSFSMNRKAGTVIGANSHAEGNDTIASGPYSHAEGDWTTASRQSSHAEGYYTTASGPYSHAEGYWTTAREDYSHAEGSNTTASGQGSHAEGYNTTASRDYSHAEGYKTIASGRSSHAEGSSTKAHGSDSHAEGYNTTASGDYSHAEGYNTTANGNDSHVQGKCNIADTSNKYADIIGNGTSNTARSNAATVDWNGNAWFAGDVYTGSTSGTNKDDGSKKLATEEYVDSSIAAGGTDISLGLTSASVGQIIKVKAIDGSGKPTEWEAVDMPSGSGSNGGIHLIARVVTEANAASIEVTGLSTTAEVLSLRIYNPGSTCGGGLCITVNGIRKDGFGGTNQGASTVQALVRAWLYRDGGTLYGRSRMANEGINVYEWPEMGEITSIAVDSHYNDGTTKYFQAGTIFEIYEGMYPNVQ